MDERNSLARSDQKGSLSLSLFLSLSAVVHTPTYLLVTRANIVSRFALSLVFHLSLSLIQHGSDIYDSLLRYFGE